MSSVRDVLLTSITNLQMNQHERAPETAEAIESFLTVRGAVIGGLPPAPCLAVGGKGMYMGASTDQ